MKIMSYSETRAKLAEALDTAVNDHEEVVITRSGQAAAVLLSLEDYESMKETLYLLRSPENARRLFASLERLEAGHGVVRDIIE